MKKLQHPITVCAVGVVLGFSFSTFAASVQSLMPQGAQRAEPQTQDSETDDLIRAAVSLYGQRKFDEALAKLNKAATLSPNDFRPLVLTGYAYSAQRKMKSASEAFAAAIRLQPKRKELYLAQAEADFFRNAVDEAVAACRKATEVDPNYAEAYAMIGNLLRFSEKRRSEAITALETALKLDPRLPQPYDDLGGIFEFAKDEKRAEEVFRKGMAADPKRMGGRFALGRMLVKQGRLSEARELWEGRTSDEDRTHPQFIELLKRAENLKRATDALAANPNDPDSLVDMGLAVMEGDSWVIDGRQKRALVYFKKALEVKPNYARAQHAIVKAFIQGVDGSKDEKKTVDLELAKLRQLDPKLAAEMEEYRKNYVGGLIGSPAKLDQ